MPCRGCGAPLPQARTDDACHACRSWEDGDREIDQDAAVALLTAIIGRARLDVQTRYRTVNQARHGSFSGKRVPIICPVLPAHRASRCALPVIMSLVQASREGEVWTAAARLLDVSRDDPIPAGELEVPEVQ